MHNQMLQGAGLGFRRELIHELKNAVPDSISFFELAPENWIDLGGQSQKDLRFFTERYPFVCHGLSLSLGGPGLLDTQLLHKIKSFMAEHRIEVYTEHLSWCADHQQLYELLPIPLTEEAVRWTAQRIRQTQEILERPIAIENASYYVQPPGAEMSETEFITHVLEEADCLLHLDVNNLYVNSQNFGFDPLSFLKALPLERACYLHVAGHYQESDGFLIDTHGASVIDPVWALLDSTYQHIGRPIPACLERDFNIPALDKLLPEVERIHHIQQQHAANKPRCA